jgi:hypothetical protein
MDWGWNLAIVFSTLAGPFLAIQAQRWIDARNELLRRRLNVFHALMRHRASRMTPEFVAAVNSVPLEFHGRGQELAAIRTAWKVYMDHLGRPVSGESWHTRQIECLIDLLKKMGDFLGYAFDPVELVREVYSPVGLNELEDDQMAIRKGMAALFTGQASLPVGVSFAPQQAPPPTPERPSATSPPAAA